jgi:hypothetical protein
MSRAGQCQASSAGAEFCIQPIAMRYMKCLSLLQGLQKSLGAFRVMARALELRDPKILIAKVAFAKVYVLFCHGEMFAQRRSVHARDITSPTHGKR